MLDVSVIVGTYGDASWENLARTRAIPSAQALGVHGVHVHANTLHEARNIGLDHIKSEWVCFLDADDELTPGYFERMAEGSADLRAPSVSYVRGRTPGPPKMPVVSGHNHSCVADCLAYGNWLIIGTLVPTELVRVVGGFEDDVWSEDWRLWAKCWQAGATVEAIPAAVYRAHVRSNSRNRGAHTREQKLEAHRRIARDLGLPVP